MIGTKGHKRSLLLVTTSTQSILPCFDWLNLRPLSQMPCIHSLHNSVSIKGNGANMHIPNFFAFCEVCSSVITFYENPGMAAKPQRYFEIVVGTFGQWVFLIILHKYFPYKMSLIHLSLSQAIPHLKTAVDFLLLPQALYPLQQPLSLLCAALWWSQKTISSYGALSLQPLVCTITVS